MSKILKTVICILSILLILFSFIIVFNTLKDSGQEVGVFCNEKYGAGNWYWKDITGTQEAREISGRFYIGQTWVCYGYGEVEE